MKIIHLFLLFPFSLFREWLDRQTSLILITRAIYASVALYERLLKDPCKKEVFVSIELICIEWNRRCDTICFANRMCSDLRDLQYSINVKGKSIQIISERQVAILDDQNILLQSQ